MSEQLPPRLRWPAALQSAAQLFAGEWFYRRNQRLFDSTCTLRILGVGDVVAIWDPELIRTVFTGGRDVLHAGGPIELFAGGLGENSLLLLNGDRHLRQRRLLSPAFHGEAVHRYAEVVAEITREEVERWPVGEEFAIWPRMQAIALETILRAVIGVRDRKRRERLRAVLPRFATVNILGVWAESRWPRLVNGRIGRALPYIRGRDETDRLLAEEIAAHRADPERRDDILAVLMRATDEDGRALSDQELRDQLATLLIAGHETTTAALAWCFERLLRHPDALARLRSDPDDQYLTAVVHETLRVRPVVEAAFRRLAAPLDLGGYRLPAGTTIGVSIWTGRSDVFPDPDSFRPERFLNGSPPPYTFIPFGGGARRCLGASFAVMEMKTVLRTVLEHVELRAPTPRPERAVRFRRITVVPSRGARVRVVARR